LTIAEQKQTNNKKKQCKKVKQKFRQHEFRQTQRVEPGGRERLAVPATLLATFIKPYTCLHQILNTV